ncbi:tape measure protein [Citrobacter portucalensis]|uniref:tape measure protein n=1 Tax=Citrobacter portucalensis TaxID=1639133 RepID=UPI001EF82327|nr:tape measure protein [Citrobacter portucalensis]ULK52447.1 tape measure protein [Citrobacter portucalensis]
MAGTVSAGTIVYEVDMDTARLLQGRRDIDAALNGLNGSMGRLEASVTRTERSIGSMERTMSSLSGVAKGLIAALSVQQVAQYADAWVTVNNKLANAVRPNEQLADVTQRIFDISQKTMSSLDATAALYGRLERATRSAGTSTEDLSRIVTTINQGLAVSGATAQEASSTMIQLSQALASGVLRGEEFNSISENGSRLAVGLADSLGVTVGQLRAMAAQGQLTTDVVVKGLLSQGDQIAKEFANTAMTMGQAFTIATNNVTKFVGESSTIKSAYNGFNSTIVTVSENLNALSMAFVALGTVMGSRFAAAVTAASAAQAKGVFASIASANAAKELAISEKLAAGAVLRRAEAEQTAAIYALNRAEKQLHLITVNNAAAVSEVKLAEAETQQMRTQLAQIESEKALETQRLKAQISEQGRIATTTRMAQLQQASAALNSRIAISEAATATARANAIASAEAKVSAARILTADTTNAARIATGAYTVSTDAATAATTRSNKALMLLKAGYSLIGGATGVIMIAAVALYYWYQASEQAKKSALEFADGLDKLNSSMSAMSNTSLRGSIADANAAIKGQKEVVSDLKDEIAALTAERDEAEAAGKKYGTTIEQGNGLLQKAANLTDQIAQKQRDLESVESKLTNTTKARDDAQITLSNNMLSSMGIHDGLIQKGTVLEGVQDAVAKAFGNTADEINRANQAGKNFNPAALEVSPATAKGNKYIDDLEEQNALLAIQDERLRAVTKAGLEAAKVTDNPNQIAQAKELAGANFDLQKSEEERKKAAQEASSEAERSGKQAESIAQKLANLKQQSELAAGSTQDLSREQAILTAQQSLGKAATDEQIRQAGEYRAKAWDAAAAAKGVAEALKAIPEAAENKSYTDSMDNLKAALTAGEIDQKDYYVATEKLALEHKNNLAKINAQAVVNPVASARAEVDPVQQLANQNNQKLALMQQYQQQEQAILLQSYKAGQMTYDQYIAAKQETDAQYLALRNAQETQYEQTRIAAQWEIYRNQSQANELLAASVDGLQSGATNAITGLINGTQSLQEAFANIGTTILGSVVGALVEMGMQWAKSQLMGQAAAAASLASTMAQATAAASAWAPAAVSASIATYGTAAAVGQTAYAGSLLAAKGMAIAGARYNGGPVQANSMYQVGEKGKPEIFKASNGSQYMIPGDNGRVISNRDMQGVGSGGSVIQQEVHFHIETTGGIDDATMAKMSQMMKQVSLNTIRDQQRPNGLLRR